MSKSKEEKFFYLYFVFTLIFLESRKGPGTL